MTSTIKKTTSAATLAFCALSVMAQGFAKTFFYTSTGASGNPLDPGDVTYTEIKGELSDSEKAAHNSAAMTGRVFWIKPGSIRKNLPDGRLQIMDDSGLGNNATGAVAGQPTWDASMGSGSLAFNGITGRLDVPRVTTGASTSQTLPVGQPVTYMLTLCLPSSLPADTTLSSGYNAVLSLGGYGSLGDRGWVNLLQKADSPDMILDASFGVEGTSAMRPVKLPRGTCSVISGRANVNGATRYAKTLQDLGESVSYGATTLARISVSRIEGNILTIGGDSNPSRTANAFRIAEVQLFNQSLDNQSMVREADAMLRRAGVQRPTYRFRTVLDPAGLDAGKIDPSIVDWCKTAPGSRCIAMTQQQMVTFCGSIRDPSVGQTVSNACNTYVVKPFNSAVERCASVSLNNEATGLTWKITAQHVRATGLGQITASSGPSNTLNCPLAPAIP